MSFSQKLLYRSFTALIATTAFFTFAASDAEARGRSGRVSNSTYRAPVSPSYGNAYRPVQAYRPVNTYRPNYYGYGYGVVPGYYGTYNSGYGGIGMGIGTYPTIRPSYGGGGFPSGPSFGGGGFPSGPSYGGGGFPRGASYGGGGFPRGASYGGGM